jgi:hypothetical protein
MRRPGGRDATPGGPVGTSPALLQPFVNQGLGRQTEEMQRASSGASGSFRKSLFFAHFLGWPAGDERALGGRDVTAGALRAPCPAVAGMWTLVALARAIADRASDAAAQRRLVWHGETAASGALRLRRWPRRDWDSSAGIRGVCRGPSRRGIRRASLQGRINDVSEETGSDLGTQKSARWIIGERPRRWSARGAVSTAAARRRRQRP